MGLDLRSQMGRVGFLGVEVLVGVWGFETTRGARRDHET